MAVLPLLFFIIGIVLIFLSRKVFKETRAKPNHGWVDYCFPVMIFLFAILSIIVGLAALLA